MPRHRAPVLRLASIRLSVVLIALVASCLARRAGAEMVPASRANDYVGREVTVEGRVVAMHDSPLASVLAFPELRRLHRHHPC
jgi:hypothetical protein